MSATALVTFLSDAMAFDDVQELIEFHGDAVEIAVDDSLLVSIGSDYRAVLVVAGTRFERDSENRAIWSTVTRLKLVEMSRWP